MDWSGECHRLWQKILLLPESKQPSDTWTPDNTNSVRVKFRQRKVGICYSFVSHHHGVLCKRVKLTAFFTIHKVFNVEAFYFAGKLGFKREALNLVMGAAPLFPAFKPSQYCWRLFPIGVNAPAPVTTTLLNVIQSVSGAKELTKPIIS